MMLVHSSTLFLILNLVHIFFVVNSNDAADLHDAALRLIHNEENFIEGAAKLELAIESVMEEGRTSAEYRQLLALCYYKLDRATEACTQYEIALNIFGWENVPFMVANYLEALNAAGRHLEALEASEVALKLHPKNTNVVYNSGVIQQKLQRYLRAIELFRLVNAMDAEFSEAWERAINCMLILRSQGLYETEPMLAYTQEAIDRFPTFYIFPHFMGIHLHRDGRLMEALAWYRRAEKLAPDEASNLANIGAVYQGLGDMEKALEVYSKLLPLLPNDAGIRNGDLEKCVVHCRSRY